MSKYVIVNAEAIQKRIEELEEKLLKFENQLKECYKKGNALYTQELLNERYPRWRENKLVCLNEIASLKHILSQSRPLIPQIEKALEAGREDTVEYNDYISNLKFDI